MARGVKPATLEHAILRLLRSGKPMSTPQIARAVGRAGSQWVQKQLARMEARGEVCAYQWHTRKRGRPSKRWILAEKS